MERLREKYIKEILPALKQEFGFKNDLEAPRVEKIVLNVGAGRLLGEAKALDEIKNNLAVISGQIPVKTLAKKSIAAFKVRKGITLGAKVTLRGARMYDFLDRLINVALPRTRDFRGLPDKFDGQGNYTIGISDITIFPEINYETLSQTHGLEVIIKTTTKDNKQVKRLLGLLGFPFVVE